MRFTFKALFFGVFVFVGTLILFTPFHSAQAKSNCGWHGFVMPPFPDFHNQEAGCFVFPKIDFEKLPFYCGQNWGNGCHNGCWNSCWNGCWRGYHRTHCSQPHIRYRESLRGPSFRFRIPHKGCF